MPAYEIQHDNGKVYEIEAPDQASALAAWKQFTPTISTPTASTASGFKWPNISSLMGSYVDPEAGVPPGLNTEQMKEFATGRAAGIGEAAKGVPILGAAVPQTEAMTKMEEEEPGIAKSLQIMGGTAASLPVFAATGGGALGAMGTSAGLSGADTLARGGTASEAAKDAAIGGLTSGAVSTAGKGLGILAKQFVPTTAKQNFYYVEKPRFPIKPDPLEGLSQPELKRMWEEHGFKSRVRVREDEAPVPLSHEKVQAVGTGLGGTIGWLLGHPEAGAFIGYGVSPGLAEEISKAAPWVAKKAGSIATSPTLQSIVYALQHPAAQEAFR